MALCDPLTVAWVEKIFAHWLSIISLKKNIFYSSHIKKAYTRKHIAQNLINQFFWSSWVPNVAKCMHVMCENNKRYDCKTARWIQKQCNACES